MNPNSCPKCESVNIYQDAGSLWVCSECFHEFTGQEASTEEAPSGTDDSSVRDMNGNLLADGDSVIVVKDLKIKGASSSVKGGTKIRNIRLTEASDGHNLVCKIDGVGTVNLKSEFVKKA